ncbi:sugar ABC transporter ATP-binding protein [Halalkalibacter okhensis]|uniref:D-ribose transporter ATP-binding protein n=1 Tax=Halalkalibacter okhensis TaxID=333138 RepID=A0A0B0IJV8_9BACI|nr:sugar ABC transporter ATP-binding protein [Halalkalibacter okhensis]KHF41610.1 D-ribose transporter ATP-binding protein [Halalkalibacter okhensis]
MSILEMKRISKSFPGVKALKDIELEVRKGEVHGLLGANGAGKSTLMKVLSGVIQPDEGEIYFKGEKVEFSSPLDAQHKGIVIIHQELSLVPMLSVAENIFLGRLFGSKYNVNWKEVHEKATYYLKQVGTDINPATIVRDLSVAQMQQVEIAKALSFNADLIIMDEPSAVLSGSELTQLFETIKTLIKQGVTVIYISHRLEEIDRICNRITIMRDGEAIDTKVVKETSREEIIRGIVGRDVEEEYPTMETLELGDEILSVNNLSLKGKLRNVSFQLKKGEILGIAGLVGAGRTEIARCIFGADKFDEGELVYKGKKINVSNPRKAIELGIALVPEDRKEHGLITKFSLNRNFTMAALKKINKLGFIRWFKENEASKELVQKLSIKTPSIHQLAVNLSGGNQQKVVVAKYLFSDADILILDEPTRGVDVGARREIYTVIQDLVKNGKSVLLISSDWAELIALSDRIVVLHEGQVKGELAGSEASPEKILQKALV